MFDIINIQLDNFKSYRGSHDFDFPREPGLYHLTGMNKANPRLGRNGVGKTSLLDAICWCLYGRSTRGLKATDVVTWGEKSCEVSLAMNLAGKPVLVRRTQNPNRLSYVADAAAGEEVTIEQATLDTELRMNYEAFTAAVILPQFGEAFFDISPASKLTLFSGIMGLEYWTDRSKVADAYSKRLIAEVQSLEKSISFHEGVASGIKEELLILPASKAVWDKEHKKQIDKMLLGLEDSAQSKTALQKELGEVKALIKKDESQGTNLENEIAILKNKQANLGNKERATAVMIGVAEKGQRLLEEQQSKLLDMEGKKCPTCHQLVTGEHVDDFNNEGDRRLGFLADELSDNRVTHKNLVSQLKKVNDALTTCQAEQQALSNAKAKRTQLKAWLIKNISDVDNSVIAVKSELVEAKAEANPFTKLIEHKKIALATVHATIKGATTERDEVLKLEAATTYWVGGFKKLRLFIIEEALMQLEVAVNNNLTALGLVDWSVKLDIERENKSGGLTKGFSVLVTSPQNENPVKWESWSGGETQRLRLAGNLGLADLIFERAGLQGNVEFYDEPSAHLSTEGIEDMILALDQRAIDRGKIIWLVDHAAMDYGNFAGTLKAIIDTGGTQLKFEA